MPNQNRIHDFDTILGPFYTSFFINFHSNCSPGGIPGTPNSSILERSPSVPKTSQFWSSPGLPFHTYFRSKTHQKIDQNFLLILYQFYLDFEPKNTSGSLQNIYKIQKKINKESNANLLQF